VELAQDRKSRYECSDWPISRPLSVLGSNFLNEESEKRCALILAKRLAERLVFAISDFKTGHSDESLEEDKRDIADVIAGVPAPSQSVCKRYQNLFAHVHNRLRSYTKSIEVINASEGVECLWEGAFTDNFKTLSNLSPNMDSLRQLADYAITRDMLKTSSQQGHASSAINMLNEQLVSDLQASPELKLKAQNFTIYLLLKLVAQTYDDFAFKLAQKPRYSSSMVNALSKQTHHHSSTFELVERVKLLNCAVLSNASKRVVNTVVPDLFNLTLFTVVHKKCKQDQKRLLIDQLFQIVRHFDSEFSEGQDLAWQLISQSVVLRKILEAINSANRTIEDLSLLNLLLLDLNSLILKIDARVGAPSD